MNQLNNLTLDQYLMESKGIRHMVDFINDTMITDYEIVWTRYEVDENKNVNNTFKDIFKQMNLVSYEMNVVFKFTTFLGNVKVFHICHIPERKAESLINSINEFLC